MAKSARDIADDAQPRDESMGEGAKTALTMLSACIAQPFIVTRTLMQVGYEPVDAVPGKSMFLRKPGFYYPNTYAYIWNLTKQEGILTALFTGLTPKMANALIARGVEVQLNTTVRTLVPYTGVDANASASKKGLSAHAYEVAVECVSKTAVVVVTQPLHVVMIRMICHLVNKEGPYNGFISTIKEIYNTEGLSGFFGGLAPRWIAEMATIVATGTLMYGVYRLQNAIMDEETTSGPNYQALAQFYVYGLVYKYQLVSTLMAASCEGLPLGLPMYTGWKSCLHHLTLMKQLGRGQSMFYRQAIQ